MDDLNTAGLSVNTLKNYRSDLSAFASWFNETNDEVMQPEIITPIDIKEYKQHLSLHDYSPSSINRKFACIKSYMNWACDVGYIDHLFPFPKPMKQVDTGPRWLDKKQQHALIRQAQKAGSIRDEAIITLTLNTGLRLSELCSLRWEDIKLSERKGELLVRNGKGGKQRRIPLNKEARKALCSVKDQQEGGFIFKGQRGPITPRGMQFMFSKLTAQVPSLVGITLHQLRHTYCKNLINAGVGIETVAKLAGHNSLESTRRYCEPSWKDLESAVKNLEW